jgi:hypothetical protein
MYFCVYFRKHDSKSLASLRAWQRIFLDFKFIKQKYIFINYYFIYLYSIIAIVFLNKKIIFCITFLLEVYRCAPCGRGRARRASGNAVNVLYRSLRSRAATAVAFGHGFPKKRCVIIFAYFFLKSINEPWQLRIYFRVF